MSSIDVENFLFVCPFPKCQEIQMAKIKHQKVQSVDRTCPIHGERLIPFTLAMKKASNLALNFVFDQGIVPPSHLISKFAQQESDMYKALVQNWILQNSAIRSSPEMAVFYEITNRNQIKLSNVWFRWTKDRQMKQHLVEGTRKKIQEVYAEFIRSTFTHTFSYVDPKTSQLQFSLNLQPIQEWYNEIWPNLANYVQEAQDPLTYELSPERHKTLLDLLLAARTANFYLHLPPVFNDSEIFNTPQLVNRFAEFAQTPNLVKRLTPNAFNRLLTHQPSLPTTPSSNSLINQQIAQTPPRSNDPEREPDLEFDQNLDLSQIIETDPHDIATTNVLATTNSAEMFRSYKMGVKIDLPSTLFAQIPDLQRRNSIERAAKGILRRTAANYLLNLSSVVNSVAEGFAPQVVAANPSPHQHYGNLRAITHTSANIADSSHYYLQIHTKGYQDLQIKLQGFDSLLHQDSFLLNIVNYLFTGYCGNYLSATLMGRWNVSRQWIMNLLRGWRKKLDPSLPASFNRSNHRELIRSFWTYIQQNFSPSPTLIKKAQHHNWFMIFLQSDEMILSNIIPATDFPSFLTLFRQFHASFPSIQRIFQLLNQLDSGSPLFFQFTIPQLQNAATVCIQRLNTAINAITTNHGNPQLLQAQRNKFTHILQSPRALSYLSQFPIIDGSYRACKNLGFGISAILGRGKWSGAICQLLAMAAYQTTYSDLSHLPHINSDQLLTLPFQSETRKNHRLPILLTSPNYILLRNNGSGITSEIQRNVDHSFRLTMPRKPCAKEKFLQANRNILSPQFDSNIIDEISWGTSTKPQAMAIRSYLQSDPFFLTLLGIPRSQLSASQRNQLTQNPDLYTRVKQSSITMRVSVPKSVWNRIQRGAQVKQLMVLPPTKPSKNFQIVLQLSGQSSCFEIAPKRLDRLPPCPLRIPPFKIGVDTNALSKMPFEFAGLSQGNHEVKLHLPPRVQAHIHRFCRWNTNLKTLETKIGKLQGSIVRSPSSPTILRKKEEIRLLHQRREGIKRQIDQHAAWVLFEVYQIYRPVVMGLENLATLNTRGKRGELAKIVNYMVKRQSPILNQVQTWLRSSGQSGKLDLVDPRHTSDRHFGCGGKMSRNGIFGTCQRCRIQTNIHHNAALNIAARATP